MKRVAGIFFASILSLYANAAFAQSCNDPAGFLKSFGTFNIGDPMVFGPDCQHTQSGSVGAPSALLGATNIYTGDNFFKSGRPWADVRAWGAVGNSVTDDTAAIQAAINFMQTTYNGGVIYVPGSNNPYCTFTGITAGTGIRIVGESFESSILSSCGHDTTVVTLNGFQASLEHINIFGKGTNNDTGTFGASFPTVDVGTNCVQCRLINMQSEGGLYAYRMLTDDIYMSETHGNSAYGSAVLYLRSGIWIGHGQFDQPWPFAIPAGLGTTVPAWQSAHSYSAGAIVTALGPDTKSYIIQAMTSGISGASAPALRNLGLNITDNTVTWRLVSAAIYYGIQCDTGCSETTITQTDFSGSFSSALALTNTLAGNAPRYIKISDSIMGQQLGPAILASAGNNLHVTGLEIGGGQFSNAAGISVGSGWTGDIGVVNTTIFGGKYGIQLSGGTNFNLTGSRIFGTTTAAMGVDANVSNWAVVGNSLGSSATLGQNAASLIVAAGTSNNITFANNDTQGTAGAAIQDASTGTNKIILNAGTPMNVSGTGFGWNGYASNGGYEINNVLSSLGNAGTPNAGSGIAMVGGSSPGFQCQNFALGTYLNCANTALSWDFKPSNSATSGWTLSANVLAPDADNVTTLGTSSKQPSTVFTRALQIGAVPEVFPASGQLVGTSDTQTLTGKSIDGSEINSGTVANARLAAVNLAAGNVNGGVVNALPNSNLANSSVTISGKVVSLGGSYTPSRVLMTPASPTSTASLTAVMSGLGGSFTPVTSGNMYLSATMITSNNTVNDGCAVQFRYGTGAAPVNGAALTGAAAGQAMLTSGSAGQLLPVPLMAYIQGFAIGTTYWLDISESAVTGGTCSPSQITMIALEQ